jgi:phosphoribosyl-ATP pyrophosphohydrolase
MTDESLGAVVDRLAATLTSRESADAGKSYTATLLSKGAPYCARKFGEEAVELIVSATGGDVRETTAEAADVIYHMLVLLKASGVRPEDVAAELKRREGVSGIDEKANR